LLENYTTIAVVSVEIVSEGLSTVSSTEKSLFIKKIKVMPRKKQMARIHCFIVQFNSLYIMDK
jgi:hypothetical protein